MMSKDDSLSPKRYIYPFINLANTQREPTLSKCTRLINGNIAAPDVRRRLVKEKILAVRFTPFAAIIGFPR